MRLIRCATVVFAAGIAALGQSSTPDVGSGAPSVLIQQQFQQAYYRNGFAGLVSYPPLADVKKLGTNGLVQEFSDATKTSGVKLALVMPNQSAVVVQDITSVFQMQAGLYSYFTSVGTTTAGMPVMDTTNCPALRIANACQYQLFDKPYALFVFRNPIANGATNFATADPYYTKWKGLGGIGSLGPAVSAQTAVTSKAGTTATVQYFDRGAVYNHTSGTLTGKLFGVRAPIYTLFAANGADQGTLGLPVSDEVTLTNGKIRQSFQGGAIDYDPADPFGGATLRTPVASITVTTSSNPIKLNLGDTVSLQATLTDASGVPLTDRQVVWLTSDARIVSVQGSGAIATVKAVGGGSATVQATSEGKTSTTVKFIVTAPCCQIGQGAPTSSITQAFQDAISRNRISVQLPAAGAVSRAGAGYVQEFQDTVTGAPYLVAVSDRAKTGFLVAGQILGKYLSLGGPAGSFGYPTTDSTAAGRQNFESGALAGTPVQAVAGDILTKWAALGYETGVAGAPAGPVGEGITFRATAVRFQPFTTASLVAPAVGRVFAVSGLIQARYAALGGPAGRLGAPAGDEYTLNARRRQDFEGGYIDYATGDTQARVTEGARTPLVTATPVTVLAGMRVRLGAGGFDDGATIRVSITGQSDFTVAAANGAFVWEHYVASTSRSGAVTVRAVDLANAAKSAQASFNVTALADARFVLSIVSGDAQTGVPGAVLPLPLTVVLKDQSGNPAAGTPVTFAASPGARIESASAVTDANGQATATVRLQAAEGVALVTASAARQVITLSARGVRQSLANFPNLTTAVDGVLADGPELISEKGAMLAATASILRYYQTHGDLPSSNGLADLVTLNQHLAGSCATDAGGNAVCDGYVRLGDGGTPYVNLWRIAPFVGGALDVVPIGPDLAGIRDRIAQGFPVLVALELRRTGAQPGPHFVAAYGVAGDGSILISDPDPGYARTALDQYINGFAAGAGTVSAVVAGSAVLIPRAPASSGFLVAADAKIAVSSSAGACGVSFAMAAPGGGDPITFHACDGKATLYQLDLAGAAFRGYLTDLGSPVARYELTGGGASTFKAYRNGAGWQVGLLNPSIAAGGVVNAASFTDAIAPGGFVSVFGAGFGQNAAVTVGGQPARVIAAYPFQVNAVVPVTLPPGPATLQVTSAAGSVAADITISAVAPALFTLAGNQGAVVNRDGTVNGPVNPARRGDVILAYGTGFGATQPDGAVARTVAPVTAVLGGVSVPILFSGLAPGFPGLYQLNVSLPAGMAPGLALPFSVQQSNSTSNTVQIAVQ